MIRLGIIGTGRIAKRFATDAWQGLDVEITAVYNPHHNSALVFCQEKHVGRPYSNWDEFVACIDAAYVAAPLGTHAAYVEKLLLAGVHVLCEKPMVVSESQARHLYEIANKNQCILMEGIKTAYSPGYQKIKELLAGDIIGQVKDVEACFTKLVEPGLREWTHVEDCGAMTEVGTYGCFAVTSILGNCPTKVSHVSLRNEEGVDTFTKVFFQYGEDATALVKAGIGVKAEGELIISGTKGYILVRAPWWMPRQIEVHFEDASATETYQCPFEGNGLQYELEYFLQKIENRETADVVAKEQSIAIAKIMEDFLQGEGKYREMKS